MSENPNQTISSPIFCSDVNKPENTFLQRIAESDELAVEAFVNKYGGFIWHLAKKYTKTNEDAVANIYK